VKITELLKNGTQNKQSTDIDHRLGESPPLLKTPPNMGPLPTFAPYTGRLKNLMNREGFSDDR